MPRSPRVQDVSSIVAPKRRKAKAVAVETAPVETAPVETVAVPAPATEAAPETPAPVPAAPVPAAPVPAPAARTEAAPETPAPRTEPILGEVVAMYVENMRYAPDLFIPIGLGASPDMMQLVHAFRDGLLRRFVAPKNMPIVGRMNGKLYAASAPMASLYHLPQRVNIRINVSEANVPLSDLVEAWKRRGVVIDHFHIDYANDKPIEHATVLEHGIFAGSICYDDMIPALCGFIVYADQAHELRKD